MTKKYFDTPFCCSLLNKRVTITEIKDIQIGVSPNDIQSSQTNCSDELQCELWKNPSECPNEKMRKLYLSE